MPGDYDIESVGYWMTPAGDKLYYVVRHACLDAIEDNWACFHADSRWQPGLDARQGDHTVVTQTESVPLVALTGLAA